MSKSKVTKGHITLQRTVLTVAQENAVDALASGKRDADAADLVGVNRITVTRWRLYSPHFQAALNERRQAVWAGSLDRLRSLVPLALNVVADELANADSPNRLQAAFGLMKLVPLTVAAPSGPTDPDVIVHNLVLERREQAEKDRQREVDDESDEDYNEQYDISPVPSLEELTATVWGELEARLTIPEPATAEPSELVAERERSTLRTDDSSACAGRTPQENP